MGGNGRELANEVTWAMLEEAGYGEAREHEVAGFDGLLWVQLHYMVRSELLKLLDAAEKGDFRLPPGYAHGDYVPRRLARLDRDEDEASLRATLIPVVHRLVMAQARKWPPAVLTDAKAVVARCIPFPKPSGGGNGAPSAK